MYSRRYFWQFVCSSIMAARQTVKQKIYLTVGGLIMASMELSRRIDDMSGKISGLCNLNLETVGGESMRERTLKLLRGAQTVTRNELQAAKEAGEIRQVRNICPELFES